VKTIHPEIKRQVILFTSRFGFITRDIFFDHLCNRSRSQKYLIWKMLIDERWLIPHEASHLSAYLSNKARRQFTLKAVPARSQYFIEHDVMAANLTLELLKLNIVERYWTERELTLVPWESYPVLGSSGLDKVPDLVIDLKAPYGRLRVAIEIERTRKSKHRYGIAALAYLGMKNVDLVIYGCRFEDTAQLVKAAFQGEIFKKAFKQPAIYLTEDFAKNRLAAGLRYQGQRYKFVDFIGQALRLNLNPNCHNPSDAHRTAVRQNESHKKEAA
jgi:hypothetical protein